MLKVRELDAFYGPSQALFGMELRVEAGEVLQVSTRRTGFVDLPVSATEDRVVGTLDIEKAIQASDLGFNPQSDGRVIRITIPALSTDVRRKMSARIKELAEEARVAIRNVRRDAN